MLQFALGVAVGLGAAVAAVVALTWGMDEALLCEECARWRGLGA